MKVNQVNIPMPGQMTVNSFDVKGEQAVNALGGIVRDVLGTKRRFTLRYPRLTDTQAQEIVSMVCVPGVFAFLCPMPGGDEEINCITSSVDYQLVKAGDDRTFGDMTVVITEV